MFSKSTHDTLTQVNMVDVEEDKRTYITKIDDNTRNWIMQRKWLVRMLRFSQKTGIGKILYYSFSESLFEWLKFRPSLMDDEQGFSFNKL